MKNNVNKASARSSLTVLSFKDLERLYIFFVEQIENHSVDDDREYETLVHNIMFYLIGLVEMSRNLDSSPITSDHSTSLDSDLNSDHMDPESFEHASLAITTINPTNVRSMMERVREMIIKNKYKKIGRTDFIKLASVYIGTVASMTRSMSPRTSESDQEEDSQLVLNNYEIDMMIGKIEAESADSEPLPSSTAYPYPRTVDTDLLEYFNEELNRFAREDEMKSTDSKEVTTDKESDRNTDKESDRNTDKESDENSGKKSYDSMNSEREGEIRQMFDTMMGTGADSLNPYSAYEHLRSVNNTYSSTYRDTSCCMDDYGFNDDGGAGCYDEEYCNNDERAHSGYISDDDNILNSYSQEQLERPDETPYQSYYRVDLKRDRSTMTENDHNALIAELLANHEETNTIGNAVNNSLLDDTIDGYEDGKDLTENLTLREIRIGIYRLLSGAAYRTFRPNYSTNKKDDPYIFDDFVELIRKTVTLVIELRIVPRFKHRYLNRLVEMVECEYHELLERVDHCTKHNCTPSTCDMPFKNFDNEEDRQNLIHSDLISRIEDLKYLRSRADALGKLHLKTTSVFQTVDSKFLQEEIEKVSTRLCKLPYIDFMNRFSSVIIRERDVDSLTDRQVGRHRHEMFNVKSNQSLYRTSQYTPGAMVRTSFWYNDFMPLLLKGMAADPTDDHWDSLLEVDTFRVQELILEWYDENYSELSIHCNDIIEIFDDLTIPEKIMMKRAWDMIRDYMIEYQIKLEVKTSEERDISQYVPFIDIHLNRSYVRDFGMRLTMPFFIGPPLWTFLHSVPEIIDSLAIDEDDCYDLIEFFKDYIMLFLRMYPCPYCRHHLNDFVKQNHEIFNYPLEYTLLGFNNSTLERHTECDMECMTDIFSLNIERKIGTVHNLTDLRLFIWKFHNAVTSSVHTRTRSKFIVSAEATSDNSSESEKTLNKMIDSSSRKKIDTSDLPLEIYNGHDYDLETSIKQIDQTIQSNVETFGSWEIYNSYAERYWPTPLPHSSKYSSMTIEHYTDNRETSDRYIKTVRRLANMREKFIMCIKKYKTNDSDNEDEEDRMSHELKTLMRSIIDKIEELDEILIESNVLSKRYAIVGTSDNKIGENNHILGLGIHDYYAPCEPTANLDSSGDSESEFLDDSNLNSNTELMRRSIKRTRNRRNSLSHDIDQRSSRIKSTGEFERFGKLSRIAYTVDKFRRKMRETKMGLPNITAGFEKSIESTDNLNLAPPDVPLSMANRQTQFGNRRKRVSSMSVVDFD